MEASNDHESDLGFSERKAKVEEEDTQAEEDESKTLEATTEHTTLRVRSVLHSLLVTYSSLLASLAPPPPISEDTPPEWRRHVEWITVLS